MRVKERVRATEYLFSECAMRLIRSLIATELLFYGVRTILSSTFEHWVLSKEALLWIQMILVGTILVNELIPLFGKRYMVRIRVLCEVLLLGWLGCGTWRIKDALRTSLHAWFDDYVPYWNAYHQTDYFLYNEGGTLETALVYTLLLIMVCMLILRYVSEKRVFLILPNIAALSAGLVVNVRPDAKSLLISFAGVLVLYSGGWETGKVQIRARIGRQKRPAKRIGWQLASIAVTLAVTGMVVGAAVVAFRGEAARIPDHAPKFLAFQLKVEDWLMSLAGGVGGASYDKNKATLDNGKPEYHDETILTIHSNQLPQGNFYLKSFCSSTYKDGTWQPLDDSYMTEADAQGFDSANLAKKLQQMTYNKMGQDSITDWIEFNYGVPKGNLRIDYENPKNHSALLPYFWNPSSSDADVWMDKDAVWRKGKDSSISFEQWLFSMQNVLNNQVTVEDTGDEEYEKSEEWYANYVLEHDRNSTADVPAIKDYADRVIQAMQANSLLYDDASMNVCDRVKELWTQQVISFSSYLWEDTQSRMYQSYTNNLARSAVALEVRNQLFRDTSYNLYLDDLPAGTDPVQYFLETGKEGYCMHYASAATLVLQELGVPARYASGFIVKEGLFSKEGGGTISKKDYSQKNQNSYIATVKDYYAHAWVEIYMDGIGWVPYEMTPGYMGSDDNMPTDAKHDEELRQEHEKRKQMQENQQASEQPTETMAPTEQDTQKDTQKETQNTQKPSSQTNSQKNADQGKESMRRILTAILILLLMGLCVYGGYWFVVNYRKRLLQELQAKRNRNAVRRINRRIYRGLMKGRPMNTASVTRSGRFSFYTRPLTDAEYAEKLMKTYPSVTETDWMRYMEIVKKCAFSHEVITEEEAVFCYKIYEKRHKRDAGA